MTHGIVTGHPKIADIDRRIADLHDVRRRHQRHVADVDAAYAETMAQWRQDRATAVIAGEQPPPQPEPPDVDADEAHVLQREHQRLMALRRRVFADICSEVENRVAEREGELRDQARELLAELEPIRAEYGALLQAAKQVRAAFDAEAGAVVVPSRTDRMRATVDLTDVAELAAGASVLDLRPLAPPANPITSAPEPAVSAREEARLEELRISLARGKTL